MLFDTITYVPGADHLYDIAGSTLSTPGDGDVITRFVAPRGFKVPTNLANSAFSVGTNPSSAATLSLKKNGAAAFGTVSISTGGVATPTVTETTFAADDVLTVEVTTANGIDNLAVSVRTVAV